jgi:hypothetical protein
MKITRSISEPIRQNLTRNERWDSDDNGLIACWERGREKALEEPGLATSAIVGQLVLLPWKGGVERALKKKEKYGCYNYLAMWQGGVQLNSWTGLCCKSQAFSVLDGTE